MKICSRCKIKKSLSEFFNDSNTGDGKAPYCKSCVYERRVNPKPAIFVSETHKQCVRCNLIKEKREFFKSADAKDGCAGICKACKHIKTKAWREKNKDKYNSYMRKRNKNRYPVQRLKRYNITLEQYHNMLLAQDNRCAICKGPPSDKRPLAIDHDHSTGKVRGLLCYGCNRLMVLLDDEGLLAAAVAYKQK